MSGNVWKWLEIAKNGADNDDANDNDDDDDMDDE